MRRIAAAALATAVAATALFIGRELPPSRSVALIALSLGAVARAAEAPADLVLRGGDILTRTRRARTRAPSPCAAASSSP